jgi:small-conductance mechanosensitive channel/CRP-like cAMP-binding protein
VSDLLNSETIGVAVAIALAALTSALLPPASRKLARGPAVFLALHLIGRVVLLVVTRGTAEERITSLFATIFLFASIGRAGVLIALDGVLGRRMRRPVPQIFRDIIQGLVYFVLLLVALRAAGVEPGSILTTSALLTAAIALSLQETLGNLVAGLAIQAQRPFDVDDWIQFDTDPKHIGRVLEINWRATKVLTLDDVEVIVPNATLAKAPIVNFTKPTEASRRSLYVQVPASVPPHVVREAVLRALPGAGGVLATPAPTVVMNAFIDGNIEYWIRFHTADFHLRDGVDSAARERIWYAFARGKIAVAAPNRAVRLQEVTTETETRKEEQDLARREEALGTVEILRGLEPEQRFILAAASRTHAYGAGEAVVRQGEATAEMFIVQSGEVLVEHEEGGEVTPLATLRAGEFFGEMAVMTGEHRTATVRAVVPSILLGVDQHALKMLLDATPDVAALISRSIAERQAQREGARPERSSQASVAERSSQILGRIRKFFSL